MISKEAISDIKNLANIADVIHGLSNITVNKTSNTKLLCHCNCCQSDKKLTVHIAKNIATCFKCDQSGKTSTLDSVSLLMHPAYGNMAFPIAIKWLADTYNYNLPD